MKKVKLGEIFHYEKKSKRKARDGKLIGKYKFFTSSNIQNKFVNFYDYDGEYLIFGTGGKASVNYCNGKFSTSSDNFVVRLNIDYPFKLIYLYLRNNLDLLEMGFKGASIKHISKSYLNSIEILLLGEQESLSKLNILESINTIIEKKKILNSKLDYLVKSQFDCEGVA